MEALAREISPGIADCELTHLDRTPIDLARARAQHAAYLETLEGLGCRIQCLAADPNQPDCVFIEDTAVVVPELAVMSRPGAASRRGELPAVEEALATRRPVVRIEAPGTLDGGDVLRIGRRLWVGCGDRTNREGARQLAGFLDPLGYRVQEVGQTGCLHFKSGCSQADEEAVLLNPEWIDPALFTGLDVIEVHPEEPFAGNVLRVREHLIVDRSFQRTVDRLDQRGLALAVVDNSELARAEGGLTCGSILLD
ncbi:MAG: hypothetical protein MK082_07825 [Phycisphaerales bacterium]|nr:hypothetical protein [Phycisphaerales bacterium]